MKLATPRGTFEIRRYGGATPHVLALHSLALSGELWSILPLGHDGEVSLLALDARGHGSSEWDATPFSVEDLADDAAAAIEATVGGPVGVVGLSMGASTALVLAARRPDLVRRLVVADGTACYGPDRVEAWNRRADSCQTTPRVDQLDFQLDRWFTPTFREQRAEVVAAVCDIFVHTQSTVHAAACRALGGLDATALLPTISAPTLVIVGEEDYATPVSMAEALAAGIPDADLMVRPGVRHLSLVEDAPAWAAAARFLQDRSPRYPGSVPGRTPAPETVLDAGPER